MNTVILQNSQAISRFNVMPIYIWPSEWRGADNDNESKSKRDLRNSIFNQKGEE